MMSRIITVLLLLMVAAGLAAESEDALQFDASQVYSSFGKGKELTILDGNAHLISGSTEISADRIELWGKEYRYALCTGNVRVTDEESGMNIISASFFYDRELKISRVDGYVELEDRKNELVAKAGFMENREEEDLTILSIGVKILKEDLRCRAEFVRFYRETEILELSGMPEVYWKGDEYAASRITIDLKKEEINLDGSVKGTVKSSEKNTE